MKIKVFLQMVLFNTSIVNSQITKITSVFQINDNSNGAIEIPVQLSHASLQDYPTVSWG